MTLLTDIEAFLVAHDNMAPSRFGVLAMNDPRFVFDLRAGGRDMKMSTITRVTDFMARYDAEQAAESTGKENEISGQAVGA